MKIFIFDILKRYSRITILMWGVLFLVDALGRHFFKEEGVFFGSIFSIGIVSFLSSTVMAQSRWLVFWRRTSESIRQYWVTVSLILLFNLMLNYMCYLILFKVAGGGDFLLDDFNPTKADVLWLTLILISCNFTMLIDYKVVQTNLTIRPALQGVLFVGIYLWIILFFFVLFYSRLLGYAFIEVSLLTYFFYRNSFVLSSILPSIRNKSLIVGLCFVILAATTSYLTEKYSDNPSDILGYFGPKKVWNFSESDFAKVDSPNALFPYLYHAKKLTSSQLLQALTKLETLCPRSSTDYPTVIDCFDKIPSEDDNCICSKLEESELHQFLDSDLEYAKLVGLLEARSIDIFSEKTKQKIEIISRQPGNLSPVALKTLASHGKDKKPKVRIRILEKKK